MKQFQKWETPLELMMEINGKIEVLGSGCPEYSNRLEYYPTSNLAILTYAQSHLKCQI